MVIELSSLKFTNKADIVPESGTEQILNTGIANTLDGKDIITGTNTDGSGIFNYSTINTGDSGDIITGTSNAIGYGGIYSFAGIFNVGTNAIIDSGTGNDIINTTGSFGIYNNSGTINTGTGNDIITINGTGSGVGIYNDRGNIYTGDGNDGITISNSIGGNGIYNSGTMNTGYGNDTITSFGGIGGVGIYNNYTLNTDIGNDIISGTGSYGILNSGIMNTGHGNDIITGTTTIAGGFGINNHGTIDTGDGNDIITGTNNKDRGDGFYNDGIIDTANGNDSIIANGTFNGIGRMFLGDGKDYLKGFGNGNFNGGNDKDILELTSGTYTVAKSGTMVSFTNGNTIMNTSDFEQLIAGSKTYDFNHLTNDQTIIF